MSLMRRVYNVFSCVLSSTFCIHVNYYYFDVLYLLRLFEVNKYTYIRNIKRKHLLSNKTKKTMVKW